MAPPLGAWKPEELVQPGSEMISNAKCSLHSPISASIMIFLYFIIYRGCGFIVSQTFFKHLKFKFSYSSRNLVYAITYDSSNCKQVLVPILPLPWM